jgi:hypothetical protein
VKFLEEFDQVSYVTNDMARAIEIIQAEYNVPPFHIRDLEFEARVGDVTGMMKLKVAVATVGRLKVELIEPLADVNDIYTAYLAPDREAGLAFHHVGVRVAGDDRAKWDERHAELERAGKVYYTADTGPNIGFVYTDERATLGHFVEHSWVKPGA